MRALLLSLATLALIFRAWSRKSLTAAGILAATLTAIVHAIHPWNVFYALLASFFLAGTFVTKVNHAQKATLTTSSTGGSGASTPSPRTATQVLCNSLPASILIAIHAYHLQTSTPNQTTSHCLPPPTPTTDSPASLFAALPYGIIASYAAAAADTFSSELGILSATPPFLATDLSGILKLSPRRVPRGTNGGVTLAGLGAGLLGSAIMGLVTVATTPLCSEWTAGGRVALVVGTVVWGLIGSVVDSVLGAVAQASVVDGRTGKVVEGEGGIRVLYRSEKDRDGDGKGRRVIVGRDILDNNGVNLVMLTSMAVGAVGCIWAVERVLV